MRARRRAGIATLAALAAALWAGGPARAGGGTIWGTVGLEMKNGNYVPGERVQVLLVRTPIELAVTEDLDALPKTARRDRLTAYHTRFFVQVHRPSANWIDRSLRSL